MCAPVGFIGWAAIQPWVQESGLSAGSQDSAGVSSAQRRSQGPINNHSRGTQGQVNSKTVYSPLHWQLDLPHRIITRPLLAHGGASTRTSASATWEWHALGCKCLLWIRRRQLERSPKTTAVVPQCRFWRDCCQVIQINTWRKAALFFTHSISCLSNSLNQ